MQGHKKCDESALIAWSKGLFAVGVITHVQSRTWPGKMIIENYMCPQCVQPDKDRTLYNMKYIIKTHKMKEVEE